MYPRLNLKISLLALFLLATSPYAAADVIGFSVGANFWEPELSGEFSSEGEDDIDISDDLDTDDPSSTSSLTLTLEHPIPILPNFRYQTFDLDSSGSNRLSEEITFEGETYSVGDTVESTIDLSHDELVLYYEVLDNWINFDLGVTVKSFDGEVALVGDVNTDSSRIAIDETIPMLFLAARFDLPLTGLYVGGEISSLSVDDSSVDETTLYVGYLTELGLGVEGGLKTFSLELDDADDLDSDIEYEGIYVNGFFRF